ncbi:hypothetical protein NDU88_007567 [Pleurodeles waltl]|uniref:Uncharacterized protein n=1 Tax=Pleurodeles waltl TaxID=8319 RepID=A0AAV7VU18_PLEWA|nr:hypothetical protein NDU88_007567 [Pleurodeles waltl]
MKVSCKQIHVSMWGFTREVHLHNALRAGAKSQGAGDDDMDEEQEIPEEDEELTLDATMDLELPVEGVNNLPTVVVFPRAESSVSSRNRSPQEL